MGGARDSCSGRGPAAFVRALLLFVLIGAAVAGPGVRAANLSIGVSAEINALDPHLAPVQPNINVAWHVFDALTRVDERARLVPGLAESWRAVDATTWEFKLRRGVKFHDGSELTAEDVVFSLERPTSPALAAGGYASFVRPIVAKEIVDPYTLRLKTATPYGVLPHDEHSIFIVSKRAALNATSEDFNTGKAMIGTGPYRLVRFARGDRVELARFDGYWDAKPAWDRVTLRVMPADPVRTAALLAGDVDLIEHVPTADIARLKANAAVRVAQTVSWRTIFLHLDQRSAAAITTKAGAALPANPLVDRRVRRALSMAINRDALVERVMQGLAVQAANLVSPPVFGHNPALKPEPYDPEGARKLLAEAGYPEGFALTLGAPNNRYVNDEQIAQAVAQMFARIGVQARVETVPFSVYLPRARKGEFPVAMLGWGSFAGDLALRSLVAGVDPKRGYGAWNWSGYANPQVDRLVEQALASVVAADRETRAREAAAVAMGDYAVVPLHHQIVSWAMKRGFSYTARTDEFTFAHHVQPAK